MNTVILVALIAACASFVGLVITKEAKISEFRHEWINKLRSEIVDLTASIDELRIAGFLGRELDNGMIPFTDENKAIYINIIRQIYSIKLRLNPNDSDCMLGYLGKLEIVVLSQGIKNIELVDLLKKIEDHSHKLLKKEWERVKLGEKWFRGTKYAIIVFLATLLVTICWDICGIEFIVCGRALD